MNQKYFEKSFLFSLKEIIVGFLVNTHFFFELIHYEFTSLIKIGNHLIFLLLKEKINISNNMFVTISEFFQNNFMTLFGFRDTTFTIQRVLFEMNVFSAIIELGPNAFGQSGIATPGSWYCIRREKGEWYFKPFL